MARKHIQQMSKAEVAFIHGFIRHNASRVNSFRAHFHDRATERTFTTQDALEVIKGGLVVEVHNNAGADVRALLRNSKGTCVVLSLSTFEVITVYYNDPTDTHDTLNWNNYRWAQDMVSLVKSLRRAQ
jgi:hypothetical protein